jgi:hypothetical protein
LQEKGASVLERCLVLRFAPETTATVPRIQHDPVRKKKNKQVKMKNKKEKKQAMHCTTWIPQM